MDKPNTLNFLHLFENNVDIMKLINFKVHLHKSGNYYVACCPFHEEKTPSFTVCPEKKRYHCFGCNSSGDAYIFFINYHLNNSTLEYRMYFIEKMHFLEDKVSLFLDMTKEESFYKDIYEFFNIPQDIAKKESLAEKFLRIFDCKS